MHSEPAPAKLNLYLHVLGRRPDGYHLLDSLVAFADIGDTLSATPADTLSLSLTGPFAGALSAEPDNLVLRAARALADAAGRPAHARLVLDKQLPVASGIGGGSADAAAALRLLQRLWDCRLPAATLHALALGLGADVPVCLGSGPCRMGGIGERVDPAPALPACGVLLVNPGLSLATPAVFRARTGAFSAPAALPAGWDDADGLVATLRALTNDLQAPATALCPDIGTVLAAISDQPGCLLARMSGSGATCFGLFRSREQAAQAESALAGHPAWWCRAGTLRP